MAEGLEDFFRAAQSGTTADIRAFLDDDFRIYHVGAEEVTGRVSKGTSYTVDGVIDYLLARREEDEVTSLVGVRLVRKYGKWTTYVAVTVVHAADFVEQAAWGTANGFIDCDGGIVEWRGGLRPGMPDIKAVAVQLGSTRAKVRSVLEPSS